jgi:hypothetical protein
LGGKTSGAGAESRASPSREKLCAAVFDENARKQIEMFR